MQFCHAFCFSVVVLVKANETTTDIRAGSHPSVSRKPYGMATRGDKKFIESSLRDRCLHLDFILRSYGFHFLFVTRGDAD